MWFWKYISVRATERSECWTSWDCCRRMWLVLQQTHLFSKFGYCDEINNRTIFCLLHGFEVLQTYCYYNLIWFYFLKTRQVYFALKFSVVKLQFRTVAVPVIVDLKTLFHIQFSGCSVLHSELLGFYILSMDKAQKLICS